MPFRIEHIRWPEGIEDKVFVKHGLFREEVEEAFEDPRRRFVRRRYRYVMLSRTDGGKYIFVVFELGRREATVITAREMTLQERRAYRRK